MQFPSVPGDIFKRFQCGPNSRSGWRVIPETEVRWAPLAFPRFTWHVWRAILLLLSIFGRWLSPRDPFTCPARASACLKATPLQRLNYGGSDEYQFAFTPPPANSSYKPLLLACLFSFLLAGGPCCGFLNTFKCHPATRR